MQPAPETPTTSKPETPAGPEQTQTAEVNQADNGSEPNQTLHTIDEILSDNNADLATIFNNLVKWDEVWVNNNIGLDSTISEVVEIILEAIKEAVQNGQSNESFLNLIERKAIAKTNRLRKYCL